MTKPPWSRPSVPRYKPGDNSAEVIFCAVGRCLTEWELVEEAISVLFATVTGAPEEWHYQPAQRAFGAVASAIGRAEMVSQATQAFLLHHTNVGGHYTDDPLYADLVQITETYKGWGGRRNDVAHGKVIDAKIPDDPTYLLVPGLYQTRVRPMEDDWAYAYTAAEIDAFRPNFGALCERIEKFTGQLVEMRTQHEARSAR